MFKLSFDILRQPLVAIMRAYRVDMQDVVHMNPQFMHVTEQYNFALDRKSVAPATFSVVNLNSFVNRLTNWSF